MTNRKSRISGKSFGYSSKKSSDRQRNKSLFRTTLVEELEGRRLLAVGPQLIGIQPNNSDLIDDGVIRNIAPRELTFRFDDAQIIDTNTVAGIRITRAGGDGSFGLNTATTDFGTTGKVEVRFTAKVSSDVIRINFLRADLGATSGPTFAVAGNTLTVTVNTNAARATTAQGLVDSIAASATASQMVTASVTGGLSSAVISGIGITSASPLILQSANDIVLDSGSIQVGLTPNENEVTYRFSQTLVDDLYRVEVFGFDDASRGVVGLKNTSGQLFKPTDPNTRQDTVEFRLDLGTQISGVVPQPVVRNSAGVLTQSRDTIVVYFDGDRQLVENDATGKPTSRSVENPDFYQLIYTLDTVRNTDDVTFKPTNVTYNAITNSVTLKFSSDLSNLPGVTPNAAFRLRVGNREATPPTPTSVTAGANAILDFNTSGAVQVRFTAKSFFDGASTAPTIVVENRPTQANPVDVSVTGTVITLRLRSTATAQNIISAIQANALANALVSVDVVSGAASTVVGKTAQSSYSVPLAGLGDTFDTSMSLGVIGSDSINQTSLVLNSSISPMAYAFDLLGSPDDPGSRNYGAGTFENHINSLFGGDKVNGITEIKYNFRANYTGAAQSSITEKEKERVREALSLWAYYLGVQFVETADQGVTFAVGAANLLPPALGTATRRIENGYNFGVMIDTSFTNSAVVLDASRVWNEEYGEDFFRYVMVGIGEVLGLTHAADLPASVLMSMNQQFLNAVFLSVEDSFSNVNARDVAKNFEPIFPSAQDIISGQYVHRPDSSDIDLYKFSIDFGPNGESQIGELTAETFAQRLAGQSSLLDTYLRLYRQTQATATSTFNTGDDLQLKFTAVKAGELGNNLRIFVTSSLRGDGKPLVVVGSNRIDIDLDATPGSETTVAQLMAALQSDPVVSPFVSQLVKVELVRGSASTKIGNRDITYSPITLTGGGMELIGQNDDYFGEDSLIRASLSSGVYYLGVSASGNDNYDPNVRGSGFGGRTQGDYQIKLNFRAQTDIGDSISDSGTAFPGDTPVALDGDGDGTPGGTYNFWFETRPLNRVLTVNSGGAAVSASSIVTVTGFNGVVRRFEFTTNGTVATGNTAVSYTVGSTSAQLASALATAINSRTELGVTATASGSGVTLVGERTIAMSSNISFIDVQGKTIFVDKSAGPNSDGSLTRPFNNLANSSVANAFGSAQSGDIIRVVGNGGSDGKLETLNDNLPYEVGFGLLPNSVLADGPSLDVPKGAILMVDPGAIFKMRRSRIGVGSTNLGIDRSNGAIQVLGAPYLTDSTGNAVRLSNGTLAPGNVYFTSWLDETTGFDNFGPTTTPAAGDWGGISIRRDVDDSAGRRNLEDEGIFLNYVNYADIRYGGGGNVVVDSVQQVVNPIQMVDVRPTLTFNKISLSADSAMSAAPNSFEETLFTSPEYQLNGSFTPDYDRVGPYIRNNTLVNNSVNGLFIRVDTLPGQPTQTLKLSARFDDIDIVHVIAANLLIEGNPGGVIEDANRPSTSITSVASQVGGRLTAGTYNYRLTFVDSNGYETLASAATANVNTTATNASVLLTNLPGVTSQYASRRLYRLNAVGGYDLVAYLDAATSTYIDRGGVLGGQLKPELIAGAAVRRPSMDASLVVDPGSVIKLEGARIEIGQGAQLLAEGTEDLPVIFTSRLDDRYGAGGTFDTTNNGKTVTPTAGNWGGIYASPTSYVSLDYATLSYGGGIVPLEGTFRGFNVLELQQAAARVAHSTFEQNANGVGGQGPEKRFGRLTNLPATIMARGTQPILLDNTFLSNRGDAITLDLNSFNSDIVPDSGRMSGAVDRYDDYDNNKGPLVRENKFAGNDINGMVVRGDRGVLDTSKYPQNPINVTDPTLAISKDPVIQVSDFPTNELLVESVWDDADVVHVVRDGIFVNNLSHEGGLRLQSSIDQSLVVKFLGDGSNFDINRGAGLTARGELSDIRDRVGGTVQIVGQPGAPVILTSLKDDTIGAGLRPDGRPQFDTNNDGIGSAPAPADWRGVLLDQYSNDRNVVEVTELEKPDIVAPGSNGTTNTAEFLGDLAADEYSGDENLRLGFVVDGVISKGGDQDIYSFTGVAGKEVWLDVDNTTFSLDTVLEVLDANGNLIARSDDSTTEQSGATSIVVGAGVNPATVNPLIKQLAGAKTAASGMLKEDGTTNPRDAGLRLVLPGNPGTRSNYFFRIRSKGTDIENTSAGSTSGVYQVQLRLREAQEFPGSTVQYADIRYGMNGLHLRGQPGHSPLLGEASEDESVRDGELNSSNDTPWGFNFDGVTAATSSGTRSQYIGNLLASDRGAISVGGTLSGSLDTDFYYFDVLESDVLGTATGRASVVLDVDYADGLNRPNTTLSLYRVTGYKDETAQLVFSAEGSNIDDDQVKSLGDTSENVLSRGSYGGLDPYLQTVNLPVGRYAVGVSSAQVVQLSLQFPNTRRFGNVLIVPRQSVTATPGGTEVPFSLRGTVNADLPMAYFDSTTSAGAAVRLADGTLVPIVQSTTQRQTRVNLAVFGTPTNRPVALVFQGAGAVNNVAVGFAEHGEVVEGAPVYGSNVFDAPTAEVQTYQSAGGRIASFNPNSNPQPANDIDDNNPDVDFNTNVLSLVGVRADQLPALYLQLFRALPGDLGNLVEIRIGVGPNPVNYTVVASSAPANAGVQGLAVTEIPSQYRIDLRPFLGQTINVLITGGTNQNPLFISDIVYGWDGFNIGSAPATGVLTGDYQLEIRKFDGSTFNTTNTNARNADSISLQAVSGAVLKARETSGAVRATSFSIFDGIDTVTFELDSDNDVASGSVRIPYLQTDTAETVAAAIRNAINGSVVQTILDVYASSATGEVTGATSASDTVNINGAATASGPAITANSVRLINYVGDADRNIFREQGQLVISNNFFRNNRDYGVWSEAGEGVYDPRDLVDVMSPTQNLVEQGTVFTRSAIIQARPPMTGGGPGPALKLPTANNTLLGGITPGVVISSNVVEGSELGGISIAGKNAVWMISPESYVEAPNGVYTIFLGGKIPAGDSNYINDAGAHFGFAVNDGDRFVIDSARNRVRFEFEDLSGAGAAGPVFGSGTVGGNGWNVDNTPIFYREDTGADYERGSNPPYGYSALEVMEAMRDAVLGSLLVTNGTTQHVTATVAMSLLDPRYPIAPSPNVTTAIPVNDYFLETFPRGPAPARARTNGLTHANLPALYLEGVNNIYYEPSLTGVNNQAIWDIRRVDQAEDPQPYIRIVNNTIYGKDGRASFNPQAGAGEINDTIANAVETQQGVAHNPISYTVNATIGDNGPIPSQDVDFYKFYMDIGERVKIDVDSTSGLNSAVSLFDQNGRPVDLSYGVGANRVYSVDNAAAPGETVGVDPYVDYTAVAPGTYYVAVSASGNTGFSAISLADRKDGGSTGAYSLSITVSHPQQFVIDVQDPASYVEGSTFTVYQVADLPGTTISSRTFEFTRDLTITPGNFPIYIGAGFRVTDVARSIASAITASGLNNAQSLPNGDFGFASPLKPVSAVALGGFEGVQPGLRLFPYRDDGRIAIPVRHSSEGIGHDAQPGLPGGNVATTVTFTGTDPVTNLPYNYSYTADARGTSEKWVVIDNAAAVQSNGNIRVDPDYDGAYNLDQLLPETGVLVTNGASPTILNNVFLNVQTPIVREESRSTRPFDAHILPEPFGSTNPLALDRTPKPGEVIIGGSIYQNFDTTQALNRQGYGIEQGPTNLPNTQNDFNIIVADGSKKLVVNAQGSNFLPAPGSPLIDSSLDSVNERPAFATIKQGAGISVSPIKAPLRDASGQLRVDDPDVAPPQGLGANVFIDRGALDRADFVGPTADLQDPLDNDAAGNDIMAEVGVVRLTKGVFSQFRLQLKDGLDSTEPFPGQGVDDSTVVGSDEGGLRRPGAAITVTENGRLLVEGIDYTFGYNPTTNELVITPLAGVFRDGRVYEITLNNRDRFVVAAPSGDQIRDGEQFSVVDSNGGTVVFEYNTPYQLLVPASASLILPPAGGRPGGVQDGDRFNITVGAQSVTFEFDSNDTFVAGNRVIPFFTTDTQAQLASRIIAAITASGLPLSPVFTPDGQLILGAPKGALINVSNSSLLLPASTLGLRVTDVTTVADGDIVTISDGVHTQRFEFDNEGTVAAGNVAVNISGLTTPAQFMTALVAAIKTTNLLVNPSVVGAGLLSVGLPDTGSVSTTSAGLSILGVSNGIVDGQKVTINVGGTSAVFEFDSNNVVANGSIKVAFTAQQTQAQIAAALAAAINASSLTVVATALASGTITLVSAQTVTATFGTDTNISFFGSPTVSTKSKMTVGAGVTDGQFFTITHNGTSVTFEFDNTTLNNGITAGRRAILFSNASTPANIAAAISSAIAGSLLQLTSTVAGNVISFADSPTTKYDLAGSPTLTLTGVPGGVIPVNVVRDASFTSDQVATAIIRALNNAKDTTNPNFVPTTLGATKRGGGTIFMENAASISTNISSFFLQGIKDVAGNNLRPNKLNNETQFTILMPGIQLDYGDAPDPFTNSSGRYPTLSENNGASHVVFDGGITLGAGVSVDEDGKPSPNGLGDDQDDGVQFTSAAAFPVGFESSALISRQLPNKVTVTVSGPGFVDGWIDFNGDGDWDDPGEQFLVNRPFFSDTLTQTFDIIVPASAPIIQDPQFAFARFRVSADGNTQPTGLATSGEVEDYRITLLPNSVPPVVSTPIPDQTMNEDTVLRIPLQNFITDPDSFDVLTYVPVASDPSKVALAIDGKDLVITGKPNMNGKISITVTATDLTKFSVSDTFDLTITPVNDAPVAVADSYTVAVNRFLNTTDIKGTVTQSPNDDGVLANDIEVDGEAMTATLITNATKGTLTLNSNGTFNYRPNPGAVVGDKDTFTYRATDASNTQSNIVTVTITFTETATSPLHNSVTPTDVLPGTSPGVTSSIDVLAIINFLNANRGRASVPVDEVTTPPPPFLDVNNDFVVSTLDVLAVINFLNARSRSGAGGEGEGSSIADASSSILVAPMISSPSGLTGSSVSDDAGSAASPVSNAAVANTDSKKSSSSPTSILDSVLAHYSEDDEDYSFASASADVFDAAIADLTGSTNKK